MTDLINELIDAFDNKTNPTGRIDIRQTPEKIQKEIAEEIRGMKKEKRKRKVRKVEDEEHQDERPHV